MTSKKEVNLDITAVMNFGFIGLSALMHFATIFWAFTLMWKTFLFRFGLTKRLRREFPLLIFIPIHFFLFFFCSAYRLVSKFDWLLCIILCVYLVEIYDRAICYSNEPLRRPNISCSFLVQKCDSFVFICRMFKNNHLCHAPKLL